MPHASNSRALLSFSGSNTTYFLLQGSYCLTVFVLIIFHQLLNDQTLVIFHLMLSPLLFFLFVGLCFFLFLYLHFRTVWGRGEGRCLCSIHWKKTSRFCSFPGPRFAVLSLPVSQAHLSVVRCKVGTHFRRCGIWWSEGLVSYQMSHSSSTSVLH